MADLVTIATTAALTQFVGPAAKHLGEQVLARARQVASRAADLLKTAGREPQPVEPKLLLPLVQAAGLETDPPLAELWAALLANAADKVARTTVQVRFVEMLRNLTQPEVKILQHLNAQLHNELFDLTIHLEPLATRLGMTTLEFDLAVYSLMSIQLCELPIDGITLEGGQLVKQNRSRDNISLTILGQAFLQAVTPPTP